ncbi:MAG: dolichol-phosphate mannosyltransferase [Verrucomicrobiota bacterium]
MTTEPALSPVTAAPGATAETLVVVPTYDEGANIAELIHQFFAVAGDLHLLVVDDNSPDGTAEIVRSLQKRYPNLRLLSRQGERGLGLALTAGIRHGLEQGFETIGTMDADLSHSPAYLPRMLSLLQGCDLVIGSRYIRDGGTVNWTIGRILLSWLANKFAAILLQIPVHDITSGYRLYRRSTLEWIRTEEVKSTGYSFEGELLYRAHRAGARIIESPIVFHDRTMGVSKLHRREIFFGAVNLLRLRLSRR